MVHKGGKRQEDLPAPKKTIHAEFFASDAGNEPVREFLRKDLTYEERKLVAEDIRTVEYGWPIGMPVCKDLKHKNLLEVRTDLPGKIVRVIFIIVGSRMILLHGFVKKVQKTPKVDLDTAVRRLTVMEKRNAKDRK
jgi:phage-related protein